MKDQRKLDAAMQTMRDFDLDAIVRREVQRNLPRVQPQDRKEIAQAARLSGKANGEESFSNIYHWLKGSFGTKEETDEVLDSLRHLGFMEGQYAGIEGQYQGIFMNLAEHIAKEHTKRGLRNFFRPALLGTYAEDTDVLDLRDRLLETSDLMETMARRFIEGYEDASRRKVKIPTLIGEGEFQVRPNANLYRSKIIYDNIDDIKEALIAFP